MSGPKGLGYRVVDPQVIERQRLAAAQGRWRTLRGRAAALSERCTSAGHPEFAVRVNKAPASESAALERQCTELEGQITASASRLERSQFDDRAREISAEMRGVLAELEEREKAAAAASREPAGISPPMPAGVDYAGRVQTTLASLKVASPTLETAARKVVEATDPHRARLLYEDLRQRIAEANQRADTADRYQTAIAELRSQLEGIPEPAAVQAMLDSATASIRRGEDPDPLLQQARAAIAAQAQRLAARSEQEFVRRAVIESWAEIGCEAVDVEVQTPESLVFRQSGSHGVRVEVTDGGIDVRTVRLDPASGTATDRDADDQLCRALDDFNEAMRRRGVEVEVRERTLPGTVTPQTVTVSSTRAPNRSQAATRRKAKPGGRERGA